MNDDVELMIERMRLSGFDQVIVFDITRAEVGIPVVRFIVPRAEAWTFYLMHAGRAGYRGSRIAPDRDGKRMSTFIVIHLGAARYRVRCKYSSR